MSGLSAIAGYDLPTLKNLPKSAANWDLDSDRSALLVHDMQRYFLQPFPSTVRDPLVRNCSHVRDHCAALGVPIFYTAQPGSMTEKQRGLLKDIWGAGMRADSTDRQIVEELLPRECDVVLTKWRYSAFYHSNLLDLMHKQGRDQLIICGVYAHIGILVTAIEAFSHDIQPFLVADAIGDFSAEYHQMAINYAALRCAVVITVEKVFS